MAIMDYQSDMNAYREEGREQGETKLARLISILLQDGKTHDIEAAVNDKARRKQLYTEYNIG